MATTPPIAFAHRGGRAHAHENTVEAFRSAVQLGATGIETDAFLTKDGVAVLNHDGMVGSKWSLRGRRPIPSLTREQVPAWIPSLSELFEIATSDQHIFIDVKGNDAAEEVARVATEYRPGVDPKVWLAHAGYNESDWHLVSSWAQQIPGFHLVDSTSVRRMQSDPQRYISQIGASPIECLNLPIGEWSPKLVAMCREAGLKTMAFRCHKRPWADRAIQLGLDGMHGDNVRILLAAIAAAEAASVR